MVDHHVPEKATGHVKEIYDLFPPELGPPVSLQLISASPEFMSSQFEVMKYFANHKTLSFPLLTAIRFMAADASDYDYCVAFNRNILVASGASEEEVSAILNDPDNAPLEDMEKAMLKFVTQAIKKPESVDKNDVEDLYAYGWGDPDILDAVAHGAFMRCHGTLMKAFIKK